MKVLDKFLRYVAIDTCSAEGVDTVPSTQKQLNLSALLADELKQMGASNVRMDKHGYVYATIPSNCESQVKLGFIAHVDTSPAVSGANIRPVLTEDYNGKDIDMGNGYTLSPSQYPSLLSHVGEKVVCTDGTTLLGADDKAGVAEIMQLAQILLGNPSIKHGTIQIGFTPDEEVGMGASLFDTKGFDANFAYTVDGGMLGEIEYENFNAASAKLTFTGVSIHPGTAKNQMLNSQLLAMEFHSLLPVEQNPMYTEGYEGFFHLNNIHGDCDSTLCSYIIRDHDKQKFEEKKEKMKLAVEYINAKYGKQVCLLELKDSYKNMKEKILPHFHLIENAQKAMEMAEVKPLIMPIRGGTDGATLSYKGLPCPNICTGGYNFHGRYEYITEEAMEKVTQILLNLVELYSK